MTYFVILCLYNGVCNDEIDFVDIIKILSDQGRIIYVYEPVIQIKSWINNIVFVNSLRELDQKCDVIIANRKDPELEPYKNKIYTRDI